MSKVAHHVRIGQIKTGNSGEILKTVLGSCVAIVLIWKRKQRYAMAHCLLPFPNLDRADHAARYVDQTIPRMLQLMEASVSDVSEIEAVVAGGGHMMDDGKTYTKFIVGDENLKMAKTCLNKHHIKIIAFESGGDQGTSIQLDCDTGHFEIRKLPKTA